MVQEEGQESCVSLKQPGSCSLPVDAPAEQGLGDDPATGQLLLPELC